MGNSVFAANLQRDTFQRESGLPEQLSAFTKMGILSDFPCGPVCLIRMHLLGQTHFLCGIFGSAMAQEFARHRLQHVKQRHPHVASVTQEAAHIVERLGRMHCIIAGK